MIIMSELPEISYASLKIFQSSARIRDSRTLGDLAKHPIPPFKAARQKRQTDYACERRTVNGERRKAVNAER
jgi:hypothetical protein